MTNQHDPKLVDELLARIDKYADPNNCASYEGSDYKLMLKAREALRPAPPKPREWWMGCCDGDWVLYRSLDAAKQMLSSNGETVHLREVLDK